MPELWTKNKEIEFFLASLKITSPEQLFYVSDDSSYYAYWPKSYKGKTSTLQSRNAYIGDFTEKFSVEFLKPYADSKNLYPVQGVVCDEIGLTNRSPADVALCDTQKRQQNASNIKAIFEVKMSIIWNWEYKNNKLICLGDYKSHKGTPGLLRSDTMLKAIGKSINIRVSGYQAAQIPIIILGNTPITDMYVSKVDHLMGAGIIQGFWSLNPKPIENKINNIKSTPKQGFKRVDTYNEFINDLDRLLCEEYHYFSSMMTKSELGKLIEIANKETTYELKAEKFLSLIRD